MNIKEIIHKHHVEIGRKGGAACTKEHHIEAGKKGARARWTVPPNLTDEEALLFWSKVDKSGSCWVWKMATTKAGYGKTCIRKRAYTTHRVSWVIANGPIPDGLLVCHKCDVRNCVNPGHLFLGTSKDNINDAKRKGRLATGDRHGTHTHPESVQRGAASWSARHPEKFERGEQRWNSKLTDDAVRYIRNTHASGVLQKTLAQKFGVSYSTIGKVVRGDKWTHIK